MDKNKEKFTENEKLFLDLMIHMTYAMMERTGNNNIELCNYEYFDKNDLFNLSEKLGIDE